MNRSPTERSEGLNALFNKNKAKVPGMSEVDIEILETFGREVCVDNKTNLPMYEPLAKLNDSERRMYDEINSRYETQFMR